MNKIYQDEKWYIGDGKGHNIEDAGTSLNEREGLNFIDSELTYVGADDEIRIKDHLLNSSEINEIITNPPASVKPVLLSTPLLRSPGNEIPVGFILNYFGDESPEGYLFCDVTEYDKEEYPELYNYLFSSTKAELYEGNSPDKFKVPILEHASGILYCIKY